MNVNPWLTLEKSGGSGYCGANLKKKTDFGAARVPTLQVVT